MEKITDTKIKNEYYLKQNDGITTIPMGNNLYLSVSKKGKCTFSFKIYLNSKTEYTRSWFKIGEFPGMTVKQAEKRAIEFQELVNSGINPANAEKEKALKNITIETLVDLFIEQKLDEIRKEGNSKETKLKQLNYIRKTLGKYKILEITQAIIYNQLISPSIKANKKSMANVHRKNIKQLFDFAMRREFIDKNPAALIDNIAEGVRDRVLNEDELRLFLNTLYSEDLKTSQKYAFHLIAMFGVRKSELLKAKFSQFDLNKGTFLNLQEKTSSPYTIYLPRQAINILNKLKEIAINEYVLFSNRSNDQSVTDTYLNNILKTKIWPILKIKSSMEPFTIHDFRRTFSTILNNSHKFDNVLISRAMGRQINGVERHYNHAKYENPLKELWQYYADYLDSLIDPQLDIYNMICVE